MPNEYRYYGSASGRKNGAGAYTAATLVKGSLVNIGFTVSLCVISQVPDTDNFIINISLLANNSIEGLQAINEALDYYFNDRNILLDTPTVTLPNPPTTSGGGGWFDPNAYTGGANTYTVKSGDTLSKIGAKLGIAWQTLASINGITAPYTIRVGQTLRTGGATSPTTTQPQTPVILQPSNLPPILTNNPQPSNNPQPRPKNKVLENFFDTTSGKLTGIGIAALILIGGIVLTGKK